MKEKISDFVWGQVLLPPEKTREIRRRKKIMKEACGDDQVLDKIFKEEYAKEKKEALSKMKMVQILVRLVVAIFLIGCWIRYAIPRLLMGSAGIFLIESVMLLSAVGISLAVVRVYREVLQKAYLGAEIAASNRYDELRKAAEASKEVAQGSGPNLRSPLTDFYVKGARQARAKRTKG